MVILGMSSKNPAEASPYARHLPALDGIRGLAALGVIASHVFAGTTHNVIEAATNVVLGYGANGVDLFFVLSGFLITGILYDSLGEYRYFGKFYARRALRIFPLYYGVLFAFLLFGWFRHSGYNSQLLSTAVYLHNTYLIANPIWLPSSALMVPLVHFWSLAVEEQFYLGWPLVVFLVRKRTPLLVICLGSLVLCPFLRLAFFHAGFPDASIHANVFARSDSLLSGAALALLLRSPWHDRVLRIAPALLVAGFAASCILLCPHHGAGGFWTSLAPWGLQYTALALCSVGLIGSALSIPSIGAIFSWRPLRAVGKYSYGLYVYHLIIFTLLGWYIRSALQRHVFSGKALPLLATGFLVILLSWIVSVLSYQLYERHFLRLKRFFDYRRHPDTV